MIAAGSLQALRALAQLDVRDAANAAEVLGGFLKQLAVDRRGQFDEVASLRVLVLGSWLCLGGRNFFIKDEVFFVQVQNFFTTAG